MSAETWFVFASGGATAVAVYAMDLSTFRSVAVLVCLILAVQFHQDALDARKETP